MQITVEQLRSLIGVAVVYRGMTCCVIEVLEDGPSLVLKSSSSQSLQHNQYGEPGRAVPETYTVPVQAESGELHGEFLELGVRKTPSLC